MEAKDTVMDESTKQDILQDPKLKIKPTIKKLLTTQAEISFKAGINEVVEWLEQYHTHAPFHNFSIYLTEEEWQAKLKELDIKP